MAYIKSYLPIFSALLIVLVLVLIWKFYQPTVAIATLNSLNKSNEAGTATIISIDGKSRVLLTLFGAPAGVLQPVHIHKGTCDKLGDIKHPLTDVFNGQSETVLDVSVGKLATEMPLAINVHKSADNLGAYVSCGNVIFP